MAIELPPTTLGVASNRQADAALLHKDADRIAASATKLKRMVLTLLIGLSLTANRGAHLVPRALLIVIADRRARLSERSR